MRKVLLASTALVGFALSSGAQAAATSPISLNVGGYTDFVAGVFHESQTNPTGGDYRNTHDFETEFKLNVDALAKASNGMEYGANVSLWNGPEVGNYWQGGNNASTTVEFNSAYVWMSGAFGKVLLGDEHGASDLFVYAPTVGEGQVDGRYRDFVDSRTLAYIQPAGIDNTEHSTKVTYYTPKVGNDMNKVQLGVSYIPTMYDYGQNVNKYNTAGGTTNGLNTSPYQDLLKVAAQYTGNFKPVAVTGSAQLITDGSARGANVGNGGLLTTAPSFGSSFAQNFTAWGLGAQAACSGYTVGLSYVDEGHYNTVQFQNKKQDVFTFGGKYEFDKVAVGLNYLTASAYSNILTSGGFNTSASAAQSDAANYVKSYNAYGAGASYTWFPGLSSNLDGVLFTQKVENATAGQNPHDDGFVLLVSQKLTF